MKPHVSVITLGVDDMGRAKRFYGEGLGWTALQDYGEWVCYALGDGSSVLGLQPRAAIAADVGVPAVGGKGLSGVTLSYLVRSNERVDEVMAEAERAGARIVRPARAEQWGGYSGYFADPDGFLWKVVAGRGEESFLAE